MDVVFNLDEIFEIAEQIERNGAKFYRAAAEFTREQDAQAKLVHLAEMEDEHERIFVRMRAELVREHKRDTVYEPDDLAKDVLHAWASRAVFDMDTDPLSVLKAGTTLADILHVAIGREKESIVYYEGLKVNLSELADREVVDRIIIEEMSHIALLDRHLGLLKQ